jgi:hypothetical protein
MSKIDLSKAKIGDKFRTKLGYIVIFTGLSKYGRKYKYMFDRVDDEYCGCVFDINGVPLNNKEIYTIVEQVFDKPLDELIEEGTKRIKENDYAIAEGNELQRREEVVELAEKMYIMFENETIRYHLNRDGSDKFCSEDLREMAIIRASSFINKKHKYLKDGKLC